MNPKKSRFSFLKQIDLFGQDLKFVENDSQTYKTSMGAIFTYLLIISIIVISFLFGKELYEKKTPYLMQSEEIVPPDEASVDLREFPLFF